MFLSECFSPELSFYCLLCSLSNKLEYNKVILKLSLHFEQSLKLEQRANRTQSVTQRKEKHKIDSEDQKVLLINVSHFPPSRIKSTSGLQGTIVFKSCQLKHINVLLIHLLLKMIYVFENLHLASKQLALRYYKANNKLHDVVERTPGEESRELGSNPNSTTVWLGAIHLNSESHFLID